MIFAIGDIHGCAYELRTLLNRLPLTADSTVVFLGDYVDRGSRSREVIDTVLELSEHCHVIPLMGNHERMFIDFLDDPLGERAGAFIYNGGSATLASYADRRGRWQIPPAHVEFLGSLRLSYESEDAFFVHAGIPDVPLSEICEQRHAQHMLWMRGPFLRSEFDWQKVVVHGHTPVKGVDFRFNRINLDTGCVFDRRLSSLVLPERKVISVPRQLAERPIYLRDFSSRREAVRFRGAVPVELAVEGQSLRCETVDYSEVGMRVRDLDSERQWLAAGDRCSGVVGSTASARTGFEATVVRVDKQDDGIHYAFKLTAIRPIDD